VLPRQMSDPSYREYQASKLQAEYIVPITEFVNNLRAERPELAGAPYVAPIYRPLSARVLSLSSNPGPKAGGDKGSRFLSVQNDDASAERLLDIYGLAGLPIEDIVPWNAFPWFVHEGFPNGLPRDHIEQGVFVLKRFLHLCPNVVSIVAHGGDAHRSVQMLRSTRFVGPFVRRRRIHTWDARHTSNRAFILPPRQRQDALEDIVETYRQAMAHARIVPNGSASIVVDRTAEGMP
jgi:hypothetical protein